MTLPQARRVATAIPGPNSRNLLARKHNAVAAGVGTTMPVFAVRAGGGVVEDADGNILIDLGSGIAVTTVGASAPRVVDAVREQAAAFTHTCFMVTPYEGYVAVAERLNRLTPGTMRSGPRCSTPGRRPWRTRSRSPAGIPAGRRWLPSITPITAVPT